jgi:DNA-binding HxlR family transcriptional regulator
VIEDLLRSEPNVRKKAELFSKIRYSQEEDALEILTSLNEKPMRFIDLKVSCESNRTRSARLKELEQKKLVKTVPKMMGRRAYTFYEITPLGKKSLSYAKK